MGGKKSKTPTINTGPYSIAEPPYQPLPAYLGGGTSTTFDSLPGQSALIAQQIHTGYPSMPQADLLKQLQGIYKPVTVNDPKIAEAAKKAQAAPTAPASGGRHNISPELAQYLWSQGQRFGKTTDQMYQTYKNKGVF